MPFIPKERRVLIDTGATPENVGEICYIIYSSILMAWNDDKRWTTAHELFLDLDMFVETVHEEYPDLLPHDIHAAADLAWQVFFIKHVMPYENQKELENGPIE